MRFEINRSNLSRYGVCVVALVPLVRTKSLCAYIPDFTLSFLILQSDELKSRRQLPISRFGVNVSHELSGFFEFLSRSAICFLVYLILWCIAFFNNRFKKKKIRSSNYLLLRTVLYFSEFTRLVKIIQIYGHGFHECLAYSAYL